MKDPAIRPDKPDIEGESSFHLLVETSQGLFRRTITRIRSGESLIHGRDVESLTKTLATAWGLPDFIFAPIVVRKGGAQREIGDAFILIGDLGACLQIKSRKESSADPEREKAWLTKNINKANKQLVGSLKALRGYQKILLRNSRNLEISITPNEIHWISVVVVDHPGLEEYFPEVVSIVLTLTDWHFLFEQLKSTYAVLQYLKRVEKLPPIELGTEHVRYYEHAQADFAATPSDLPLEYQIPGATHYSGPLLPMEPAASDGDSSHGAIRSICEVISNFPPSDISHEECHLILVALDSVPVSIRTSLGDTLTEWFNEAEALGASTRRFRARNIVAPSGPHLMFCITTENYDVRGEELALYVRLRRKEFVGRIPDLAERYSVGIFLSPCATDDRPWDLILIATRNDADLTPEEVTQLQSAFGALGITTEGR